MGEDGGMRLILVRHGQTSSNVDHLLDTAEPGADLTEEGRRQARALVERLADEPIAAIHVSTLVRTQQTAAPLAAERGLTPTVRAEGREIEAGTLEMSGAHEDVRTYVEGVFRWVTEDMDERLAEGETGTEVLERFDDQVAHACAAAREAGERGADRDGDDGGGEGDGGDGGAALIVAHGSVLRFWIALRARASDVSWVAAHPLPNTGIVILEGEPEEGWTLVSYDGRPASEVHDEIADSRAEEVARDERE